MPYSPATADDYRTVFGSPQGALILEDLLQQFHFYTPLYDPRREESNMLIYREGQRSVVIQLRELILASLDGLQLTETYNMENDTSV